MFDDEALEVLIKSNKSENKFVGGENRWNYDAFTNWEFWWKQFPVLVYFKASLFCENFGLPAAFAQLKHCETSAT